MNAIYTISRLARAYGLSRSSLLYYDRIGLLPASTRTSAGYRCYSQNDADRLARICTYREAGLSLAEIRSILSGNDTATEAVIESRVREIGEQIKDLKAKQRLLCAMLRNTAAGLVPSTVDKETWVQILQAAGMNEQRMADWHSEFERRAPGAHNDFLVSLGIPEAEVQRIREWSARAR